MRGNDERPEKNTKAQRHTTAKPQPNRAKRPECGVFPRSWVAWGVRKQGNTPHSRRFATSIGARYLLAAYEQVGLLQYSKLGYCSTESRGLLLCSAILKNHAVRARFSTPEDNRRGAKDAERRARNQFSALFAVLSEIMLQFEQHLLSGELRELRDVRLAGGQQCRYRYSALIGHHIPVGAADFRHQPMSTKQRQPASHPACPSPLFLGAGTPLPQQHAHVPIAKSVHRKLPPG